MDILMGYTFFSCKIFHLHTSYYIQSSPASHPSMVFLSKINRFNFALMQVQPLASYIVYLDNNAHCTFSAHIRYLCIFYDRDLDI